jgi:hypothetical protein
MVKGRERNIKMYLFMLFYLVNGIKKIFVVGMMLIYPIKDLKKLNKLAKFVFFINTFDTMGFNHSLITDERLAELCISYFNISKAKYTKKSIKFLQFDIKGFS